LNTVRDLAEYDAVENLTSIINHIVYESFGKVLSQSTPTDFRFWFTSRPVDEFTSLQSNWHRWYSVDLGWWLSEDPIGLGPDENARRYVKNHPTFATDPSGLDLVEVYSGVHAGIEVDLWDEDDNRIGKLTVDYGARGWRNGGGSSGDSSDGSSASFSSLCNSHRSHSIWSGAGNSGDFLIGILPGALQRADSGRVYYKDGSIEEDRRTLAYIARSVGLTSDELIAAVQSGQNRFRGQGRWYGYTVFGNSCRSFANRMFYEYRGTRVTE